MKKNITILKNYSFFSGNALEKQKNPDYISFISSKYYRILRMTNSKNTAIKSSAIIIAESCAFAQISDIRISIIIR